MREDIINFINRCVLFDECPIIDGIIYKYDDKSDSIIAIALEHDSINFQDRILNIPDFCDELNFDYTLSTVSILSIIKELNCNSVRKIIINEGITLNDCEVLKANNIINIKNIDLNSFKNLKYLELNGLLELNKEINLVGRKGKNL